MLLNIWELQHKAFLNGNGEFPKVKEIVETIHAYILFHHITRAKARPVAQFLLQQAIFLFNTFQTNRDLSFAVIFVSKTIWQ